MSVPSHIDLALPTLQAIKERGGSSSIDEICEAVANILELPPETLEIPHGTGSQSEFEYRAGWARTYLKMIGAVENSSRGVWSITAHGRSINSETKIRELFREVGRKSRRKPSRSADSADHFDNDAEGSDSWEGHLLDTLAEMPPDAFERLCQRVLRESGFTKVEVTGKSGDGGIDGMGVLRVNLISFQVVFQCKRYAGTVGSGQIRDFRGAMVGRADKGLLLTTGRFSLSASQEAVRDGAPAIDLVDGTEFCHLLKSLKLGVEIKMVEEIGIDKEFFNSV